MENIENLLNIYEQLRSCTNPDDVETLKKSLNISNIQSKEVEKEGDLVFCKNGGSKEPGIPNVGMSRMLSVADKSREVDNLIKEAKELAERGKFGEDLTIEVHEEMQVRFPTSDLVGDNFASYIREISDLLSKNKASAIGIWGMGGVGKTTLIKHLHDMMLDEPQIYGSVYWITVSKDWTIHKLQNDIANKVGESNFDKLDESQRAGILVEALKRKKKFVLILDDMWSLFDLNEVGLGFPKEIGYRLIITSRSKDVCLKMYCDNIIKVDPLSPEDARTLFNKSIVYEIPDDLKEISTDVLQECAGLPLGIITLAKTMIGCNDMCEWRNVLDELRNSSGKVDDMKEKVFKVLKLSYERLNDCDLKECLLYCGIYPEDFRIPVYDLVWLFIDSGLLGENVGIARMFDKGLVILKKLERAALLTIERLTSHYYDDEVVYLHDLIRDMIFQISGSRFMIKPRILLKGIPDGKSWTDQLEVVSLMDNGIVEISNSSPKCNRLSTLLLQRNDMRSVSDGFFKYLHGLKHLNLSYNYLTTLPKSISLLKNLTALTLRYCWTLEDVPSLAELSSLEKLDLYQTSVSRLPKGIGSLIKLRYLDLFDTRIETIGVGVISKLTALQYLATDARFDVEALNSLNNLEHLTVVFVNFVSFSTFLEQMKIKRRPISYMFLLENFIDGDLIKLTRSIWSEELIYFSKKRSPMQRIMYSLGCWGIPKRRHETERRVKLIRENNEVQKLLQDIHSLEVDCDADLTSLVDFVFDTVCNLQRQTKIGRPKQFSNLKILKLYNCPNLKKLFPLELLSNLQNMEETVVYFCQGLEELIQGAHDETKLAGVAHPEKLSIPKLRRIRLRNLPNLQSLCDIDKVIHAPSLEWIAIVSCPKLKRMPFDVASQHRLFYTLCYLEDEKDWVESLEWDPPEHIFYLQALASSDIGLY